MANVQHKAPVREPVREPVRQEIRLQPGQAYGRDGKIVTRRGGSDDPLEIPEYLKEDGWSYQWVAMSCYGQPFGQELNTMIRKGWDYVKPTSQVGKAFTYPGYDKDFIEVGGLVLMERPQSLTDEALEEMRMATAQQYNQLMGKSSDLSVPRGFETRGKLVKRNAPEAIPMDMVPKLDPRVSVPDDE